MKTSSNPILILGAGINGAALARELLLNRVPVCLVDSFDIASGTTAYSSRLIHGGLRYLEYGDYRLVRESLDERTRLLRLAPHLVQPLKIFIPVKTRISGLWQAAGRFLGWRMPATARGLWVIRLGLRLYDAIAGDASLPRHAVHCVGQGDVPPVDRQRFRWLCSYYDAQVEFPERFVMALLEDARELAKEHGVWFRVLNYHRFEREGGKIVVYPELSPSSTTPPAAAASFEPAAIVNATGSWVDQTNQQLELQSRPLLGGTKGSHLFTSHERLREALAGQGIYAEAVDGRPIFVLPMGQSTLIGTTDLPFHGSPETAVASHEEVEYLIASVNHVLPQVHLSRQDIEMHYSGVRPLPAGGAGSPAAITRRHHVLEHQGQSPPVFSIVGGKLTTCRSLAQECTQTVLERIGGELSARSHERAIPGGSGHPATPQELLKLQEGLVATSGFTLQQIQSSWRLVGTRTEQLLTAAGVKSAGNQASKENVLGTTLPVILVKQIIRGEWVAHLGDLVERRLMLLYKKDLSRPCLTQLARLMAEEGVIDESEVDREVETCADRLQDHFGKTLLSQAVEQ